MNITDLTNRLVDQSLDDKRSIAEIALKITEENGEVAQAVLGYLGSSGNEYKNEGKENVLEECVDVVVTALSLYIKVNGSMDGFAEIMEQKMDKWDSKVKEGQVKNG